MAVFIFPKELMGRRGRGGLSREQAGVGVREGVFEREKREFRVSGLGMRTRALYFPPLFAFSLLLSLRF